ncbi:hypothetical protein K1719_004356 [Acacia pycnantha]|nr:hypothetical protein K1719_004356 [Acacia pycnantha]
MLLSALLTSVGINLGLCFLFFTLYSILRKLPGNIIVYAPRLVAEGKLHQEDHFNLAQLLPTSSWVKKAWEASEDELISKSGLDAFIFMRMFIFSLRVFSIGGIFGMCILLPINYMGSHLSDDSDFQNKSLESFSISNVDNGSNRLWIHLCAAYVFTGVVCYLLYYEYGYISSKRIACFFSSEPLPHQFTLLVRGIPVPPGSTCNETVEQFFKEYHPSTYLSHSVIRRSSKLQSLINDAEKLYKKLATIKDKIETSQRQSCDGCLGLLGHKVDCLDLYERRLQDIEDDLRMEQSSLSGKEVPAAFVSFNSRFGAAIALNIQEVQGLANLEQLELWFPFLKSILTMAVVSQVITGYLPSLILHLFLSAVPPAMIMLSSLQGYISWSRIQKSACSKVLWFTIWNIFFANVLSGSALYRVNVFLEPKQIPTILAEAVPAQASFFIAYVVTGWTNVASELFQLLRFICNLKGRICSGNRDNDFEAPSFPYHSVIPGILFFILLGITYFLLAPLILPFLLVYFCLGYIIYRNQLLNVYVPKYDTGGEFWAKVHNCTIFSLVLMHIIAIGIFGLKKLPLASGLALPLPFLTLLFNDYCRKRFFPLFHEFPAECLIKRDKQDHNEAHMSEFYDKLTRAYDDPAMMPKNYTGGRNNSPTSPLLQPCPDV